MAIMQCSLWENELSTQRSYPCNQNFQGCRPTV